MRWSFLLLSVLVVVALAQEEEEVEVLPAAEPCDPETCRLPACRCSSTSIPGNLLPRHTPQFVMFTFDDAVNIANIETYRNLLYNRRNKNSCHVGATFYVSHEYTSYQLVNELYNQGFEIALHSISHRTPQSWWAEASVEDMRREFADQILMMEHFANIPRSSINGLRKPFLQMSGNSTFQMMKETGLTYDCSWPTISYVDPGLWPYTLDHASTQDCVVPPCPTGSIPGSWVIPMISWRDLQGTPCSMADACFFVPNLNDEEAWFRFIVTNFERHYLGTRAPFGIFIHEWYFRANPAVFRAYVRFLDMLNNLHDVFMVNTQEVINWVRNPIPLDEYAKQPCRMPTPTHCHAANCGPLVANHTELQYWMAVCTSCPPRYPWVGNPFGLENQN